MEKTELIKEVSFPLFANQEPQWRREMQKLGGLLSALPRSKSYEIVLRPKLKDKTKKQLGAMFGVWYPYILDKKSEHDVLFYKKLAKEMEGEASAEVGLRIQLKSLYLVPVVLARQSCSKQFVWCQALTDIGELLRSDDPITIKLGEKLSRKHIYSLSAGDLDVKQMTDYMRNVEEGLWVEGINVPIPDKMWNVFPPKYTTQAI